MNVPVDGMEEDLLLTEHRLKFLRRRMWHVCVRAHVRVSPCSFISFFFFIFSCFFGGSPADSAPPQCSCVGVCGMCVFARTSELESVRAASFRSTIFINFSFFFLEALLLIQKRRSVPAQAYYMWYVCLRAHVRVRVSTCLCCIRFFFQFFF